MDRTDDDADVGAAATFDSLRVASVREVTTLLRTERMASALRQLEEYGSLGANAKNSITKDDPEHGFIVDCSNVVLQIDIEKSKVHKFVYDRYSPRFPELARIAGDGEQFISIVQLIENNVDDLSSIVGGLLEVVPSQLAAIIIAAASTTQGMTLPDEEMTVVKDACQEMKLLEDAKQMILEYIQLRIPLVAPNLCAFLGTGITSQLFALCGGVTKLTVLDAAEIAKLGSRRKDHSGIPIRTSGFLSSCDLVANQPPQLRAKALRLVANTVLNLARVDDNRRASDYSEGLKLREDVRLKMIQWTDPLLHRGAANNTYDRSRKRRRNPVGP